MVLANVEQTIKEVTQRGLVLSLNHYRGLQPKAIPYNLDRLRDCKLRLIDNERIMERG